MQTFTPTETPVTTRPLMNSEISKSTSALNQQDHLDIETKTQPRKNQPSMGLRAYNLKKKPAPDAEMVEPKRERLFKNKSMMFNEDVRNNNVNTKSDTNLMRDVNSAEVDAIYGSLENYESNKIYFSVTEEMRAKMEQESEQEKSPSQMSDNSEKETLVPFLDNTRDTCLQPLLSSTRSSLEFEFDSGSFEKQFGNQNFSRPTPLRISAVSRVKKLKTLNNDEFIAGQKSLKFSAFNANNLDENANQFTADL